MFTAVNFAPMTKSQAREVFGSFADVARALNVSRSYVSRWPEDLPENIADRIRGAAVRLGKPIPGASVASEIAA